MRLWFRHKVSDCKQSAQQYAGAAYHEGIAAGVFIKDMTGRPYIGQVGDMTFRLRVPDCKHTVHITVLAGVTRVTGGQCS
jgi:hypothetical protein